MTRLQPASTILKAIAGLTATLVAQDAAATEAAETRRRLVRLAVAQGYTLTEIGEASGITRQRVAQLAKENRE